MNVTVENIGPCKRLLQVELGQDEVKGHYEAAAREFLRGAKLPGFRPGKAPRDLVLRTYASGIRKEAMKRALNESFAAALKEQGLRPIVQPEVDPGTFSEDAAFSYKAELEIEPEFTLPEYRELPVQVEMQQVTEADLQRAMEVLREQKGVHVDVDRPVSTGDVVVIAYTGTCEGKPITDFNPTARGLTRQDKYWLEVRSGQFIPGFADQLLGAVKGEQRTVNVTFPDDFLIKEVAGKAANYEVTVQEVKERKLPLVDEEFARSYGAESLEALRAGVRKDLERELADARKRSIRDQLVASLLARVNCELPDVMVKHETRNLVYDIVRANAERGMPKEAMDEQRDQIYAVASNSAQERVKARFILERIGEAEKVSVTQEEMTNRVLQLAATHRVKPDKLVKQLQEQNAIGEIRYQILSAKVLDLLEKSARIEAVPARRT